MTPEEAIKKMQECPIFEFDYNADIDEWLECFEVAIEALEKQEKYKWHDLRDNPNDIPKNYDIPEDRLIILKTTSKGIPYIPILRDMLKPDIDTNSIIAWKEIEPFEEDE